MIRIAFALLAILSWSAYADYPVNGACPSGEQPVYTNSYNSNTDSSLSAAETDAFSAYAAYQDSNSGGARTDDSVSWSQVDSTDWQGAVTYEYYGISHTAPNALLVSLQSCNPPACNTPAGSELGAVPSTGFYNSDGSVQLSANAGDSSCVSYCQSTATQQLVINAHLSGSSAATSAQILTWVSTGQSCSNPSSSTPSTGNGNNGFLCAKAGTVNGCTAAPGTIGDAADYRVNGQDLGPSATTVGNLQTDGCITLSSGAAFCMTSAVQPDNGSPGQPDTPAAVETLDGTQCPPGASSCTFNYYTSSQIQDSTNYGSAAVTPYGTTGGSTGGQSSSTGGASGGSTGGDTLTGGTDCTAPPTCTGDAIACYSANEDWKTQCELQAPTTDQVDSAIDAGLNVDNGGLVQTLKNVDVSTFFNPTAASTACPSDLPLTLSLLGSSFSVTVPLSQWCTVLHVVGLLILAGAAVKCAHIYGSIA